MSLVDYASSDEEDEAVASGEEKEDEEPKNLAISSQKQSNEQNLPSNEKSTLLPVKQSDRSLNQPEPSVLRLPDASLLLDSPAVPSNLVGISDHSSRVAAAIAQNASRKRDSRESTSAYLRGKIPKGILPHSKSIPDTADGLLRPPQLNGRSNVVTEDINKLFVRRNVEPSSGSSQSQC